MRNAILGTIAGLAVGTVGALAYSHYLGDGSLLAGLQSQLDAANAKMASLAADKDQLKRETSGISSQVDELSSSNQALRQQLDDSKKGAPATAAAAPALNPMTLGAMMMGAMRGGMQGRQRMLILQSRLHLTPDQATAIKDAMDADNKARRDLMGQMFRNNGKIDPQAAAQANTLDQTLTSVLTPDQQAAYKQVQADEQISRADISATTQVDQMMPLLQLSDSQKDQVYNSIYQAQMTAPDPMSLITNPNAASVVTAQAQATQAALAKVLTTDQMALYQQEAQAAPQFGQGGFGRRGGGGDNGGGGGNGGGGNNAPAPTAGGVTYIAPTAAIATPASTTATTSSSSTDTSTNSAPTPDASSTNSAATNSAPAATNALPAQ
jgi:uncharacterized membrane protein YgcG